MGSDIGADARPIASLGVLAGRDFPLVRLAWWAGISSRVYAADSAADRLHAANVTPHVVLGDMDSVSDEARNRATDFRFMPDQETTDADKLLTTMVAEGARQVILCGVEGDLPDHFLASLQSAIKCPVPVWMPLRRGYGRILKAERVTVGAQVGRRFSVIPFQPCRGVEIIGAEWPLTGGAFDVDGFSGISNRAISPDLTIEMRSGSAFLFVEAVEEADELLLASYLRS